MYTIGQNSFGHLLSLTEADRRKHVYLSGKTGTGKSTLLLNFMHDDLKSGRVKPVDGEEAFAKLRHKSKSDARRARS